MLDGSSSKGSCFDQSSVDNMLGGKLHLPSYSILTSRVRKMDPSLVVWLCSKKDSQMVQ